MNSPLPNLGGKNVVVVGGSRGTGRAITDLAHAAGAKVLAVGRERADLDQVARKLPGLTTLVLDATSEQAPEIVFEKLRPDVLVVCAGALPPTAPIHQQDWNQFSRNWNVDVKASFQFAKAALTAPLSTGAIVIFISSGGAVMGGSPISGGYAGAKRMQMFVADYAQTESNRLKLGIRFLAVAPLRPMRDTGVGTVAIDGYSRYLGISPEQFMGRMDGAQTKEDVARAVVALSIQPPALDDGNVYIVSGKGVAPME